MTTSTVKHIEKNLLKRAKSSYKTEGIKVGLSFNSLRDLGLLITDKNKVAVG